MVNDRNARNDSRRKHWFETVDNGNSKLYGGIESLRSSLEEKYSKRDQHLDEMGQKLQKDLNKKKRDKDKKVSDTLQRDRLIQGSKESRFNDSISKKEKRSRDRAE